MVSLSRWPCSKHAQCFTHTADNMLDASILLTLITDAIYDRELFDTEVEAARAYDRAVWRLKPKEAKSYVNFKDSCPPDVADMLRKAEKVCTSTGL